ncbi:5343_t:CDS:2, partial [Gigaspora margarita]
MNPTSTLTLSSVLETNPIPNMLDQQSSQNHLSFQNAPNPNNSTDSTNSISPNNNDSQICTYWRPSPKLKNLYNKFQDNILAQWPRIACVFCECLLYPKKASWIIHDLLVTYPLQQYISGVLLSFNPNVNQITKPRVPTCKFCKNPTTRFLFSYLSPMPEIISVPLHKRKHLSPVYLHCSLGRTPNSNPYAEYRSLTGTMGYSPTVKFLTTEPPPTRSRSVLLAYMIDENNENPYYNDTIMKYMHRPLNPEFENLTYPQYFEQYSIIPSQSTTSYPIYRDQLQNYIIKRTKKIMIRYRYLKLENAQTTTIHHSQLTRLNNQFSEMLDRLLYSLNNQLPTNLYSIIQSQLETLKILPHIFPLTATLELPAD